MSATRRILKGLTQTDSWTVMGSWTSTKTRTFHFHLGKRRCPGEGFAKKVMFLFITVIYQRYGFEAADGETLPDVADGVIYAGVHNSPPYKLTIVPR
ncbi:cytochrome P450 2C23-like isoform X2 [Anneissia japonica]|uniref:cytochrome P450 2C23-like isoform X2 n=1 Tax=Anneissia japonica TaxID=1529436 RepID=UPI00142593C4|nr:cytochrome P450 2C23-like isoform X2 [Anneissia japonica]